MAAAALSSPVGPSQQVRGPRRPPGGLTGCERFATDARDARVVDVDTDHYSILISPPAISAIERFVGAGTA